MGISRDGAYNILGNRKNTDNVKQIWPGYEEIVYKDGVIVSEFRVDLDKCKYVGKDTEDVYFFTGGAYDKTKNVYAWGNTFAAYSMAKYKGDRFQKMRPAESIILNDPVFGLNQFRTSRDGGSFTSSLPLERERLYVSADQRTGASGSEVELEIDVKKKYELQGYKPWDTEGKETVVWSFDQMYRIVGMKHTANVKSKKDGSELVINEQRILRAFTGPVDKPADLPDPDTGDWVVMDVVTQSVLQDEDTFSAPQTAAPPAWTEEERQEFERLKALAETGDGPAVNELAILYWDGKGCERSLSQAVKLLEQLRRNNLPVTGFKRNFLGSWSRK